MSPAMLDRLRALRLWHWRMAMRHRALQHEVEAILVTTNSSSLKSAVKTYADAASVHLHAVQTLNEFFPIGDTAEADDK